MPVAACAPSCLHGEVEKHIAKTMMKAMLQNSEIDWKKHGNPIRRTFPCLLILRMLQDNGHRWAWEFHVSPAGWENPLIGLVKASKGMVNLH